jgi:phosphatidate cytidylyltransferase
MTDGDAAAGRAVNKGRDFTTAVPIGIALVLGLGASAWWLPQMLIVAVITASLLGVTELRTTFAAQERHLIRVPLYACSILMPVAAFIYGLPGLMIAFASGIAMVFAIRMFHGETAFVRDVSANIFVLSYVPLLLSFIAMLIRPTGSQVSLDGNPLSWHTIIDPLSADPGRHGALRLIVLLLLNVGADTSALVVGMAIGRHQLAPLISPKKTWEGFIGSLVFNAIFGAFLLSNLLHHTWWHGVIVGLVTAAVAAAGDLCESMIKRDLGVKDMSHLIPGHGGIMDRLDSLLPNAFAVWVMFAVML